MVSPDLQVIHFDDGSKLEEKLAPHGAKKALGLGVRKVKLQQKLEMYEPHPTR